MREFFLGTGSYSGRNYVVFGKTGGAAIDLSAVANGNGGFVIKEHSVYSFVYSSVSVAAAGDVNGDGLADLIAGEPSAGRSYIVFGKTGGAAIDLSAIATGSGGFVIDGSGESVAAAGDVNGDGLADLIVGASSSGRLGATPTDATMPGAAMSFSAQPAARPSTSRRLPMAAAASSSTVSVRVTKAAGVWPRSATSTAMAWPT